MKSNYTEIKLPRKFIKSFLRNVFIGTRGKFFTVEFTKKDGGNRVMLCRTGVVKGLNPLAKPRRKNKDIQIVWDVHKKEYRSFRLDSVKRINQILINQ